MPTKLKKPITITITHVENAITQAIKSRHPYDREAWSYANPRHKRIWDNHAGGEVYQQIAKGLEAQGIDWRTWEPPQPIYIAGCEADFKSNGDVKLGSETLDRATLVEVLKRSDEAMGVEPEWPQYFRYDCWLKDIKLVRFDSREKVVTIHEGGIEGPCSWSYEDALKFLKSGARKVLRAEACAILGREV